MSMRGSDPEFELRVEDLLLSRSDWSQDFQNRRFLQNVVEHQQGQGGSGPGVDGCHEGKFVNPMGRGGVEWRGKKGRREEGKRVE
jgi:hypothetical protein